MEEMTYMKKEVSSERKKVISLLVILSCKQPDFSGPHNTKNFIG